MSDAIDPDLIRMKMDITDISNRYVDVHNTYLKLIRFSFRSMFRRRNYEPLYLAATAIQQELDDFRDGMQKLQFPEGSRENEFLDSLREYSKSLRRIVGILVIILRNLHNKTQGNAPYPTSAYSGDFQNYNAAITIHLKNKDIFRSKYDEYRSGTEC